VRRTVVSVRGRSPAPADESWAISHLRPAEEVLWWSMPPVDRAHALEVARGAARRYGPGDPVVVAGLLHDVGKVDASLGVPGRVVATLVGPFVPDSWAHHLGRLGRHLAYPRRGAELLAEAGSDPLVVAWAAEHHQPPDRWTIERRAAEALRAADDAAG